MNEMSAYIASIEVLILMALCLAAADSGMPRTVYHDRIDGLILPACEPLACFWPA